MYFSLPALFYYRIRTKTKAAYISVFEYYKDIKEIADFIDDVGKLRFYFSTQQFDEMQNHINSLFAVKLICVSVQTYV